MRPTYFAGTLRKVLEIPTALLEITPHFISMASSSRRPHAAELYAQTAEGPDSFFLESFIRDAKIEGYVVDLILCGPQAGVEFARPAQPGGDTNAWAEKHVLEWLPKGMEPNDTVWSLDSFAPGQKSSPFCMFSLFRKEYMQEISDALTKAGCILRSVHGGAYSLLTRFQSDSEPYAILHLSPEYSRVLVVEDGMPVKYQEIPSETSDADWRITSIERLTNFHHQVHRSRKKINRFIVDGPDGESQTGSLTAEGYTVLPASGVTISTTNFAENLPPEIGAGHCRSYATILRSRNRLLSYAKATVIAMLSCAALLGLFEAGVRTEKLLRAERYRVGETILAGYAASRASLSDLELRYGDFFSAISNRADIPLYFDAVVQALPERVWLTELTYGIDRGEKSLEFVGYTDDPTQIARFLGRLQENKSISGVEQQFIEVMAKDRVAQMTRHTQGARELTKFKAGAVLK